MFFFFLIPKKGYYKRAGFNQQCLRGTCTAFLTTLHTDLSTKWGTRITWQRRPFCTRKFKSASLYWVCQSEAFLVLKSLTNPLLSLRNKILWNPWYFVVRQSSTTASSKKPFAAPTRLHSQQGTHYLPICWQLQNQKHFYSSCLWTQWLW